MRLGLSLSLIHQYSDLKSFGQIHTKRASIEQWEMFGWNFDIAFFVFLLLFIYLLFFYVRSMNQLYSICLSSNGMFSFFLSFFFLFLFSFSTLPPLSSTVHLFPDFSFFLSFLLSFSFLEIENYRISIAFIFYKRKKEGKKKRKMERKNYPFIFLSSFYLSFIKK